LRRVTLNGIKRVGLSNWKARKWWIGKRVRIWSAEHCAWLRSKADGYTTKDDEAGLWDFPDAYDKTKHCDPKKRIMYYVHN
jgi:hypothetical protein